MNNLWEKFPEFLADIARWALYILVGVTIFQVFSRYVLVRFESLDFLTNFLNPMLLQDLEWWAFSILFLLGMAWTWKQNGHVRVDIFYQKFSEVKKQKINFWGFVLLALPFLMWGLWTLGEGAWGSFETLEGSANLGGMPYFFVVKSVAFLGFLSLVMYGVREILVKNFGKF